MQNDAQNVKREKRLLAKYAAVCRLYAHTQFGVCRRGENDDEMRGFLPLE